ncbi:hypothetical protein NMG60_11013454 [Bertholletia excelsa]
MIRSQNGDSYELADPFGDMGPDLLDSELRQTAYEIFVGACRSTGGKPLTYISRAQTHRRASSLNSTPSVTSLQRSMTLTATKGMKNVFGLKSSRGTGLGPGPVAGPGPAHEPADLEEKAKRPVSAGDLVRVHMGISEQTDSRIRRGLLRVSAGQEEYEAWQRRYLKILEAGLLLHPHLPLDKTDPTPKRLRQIIYEALGRPSEIGKQSETMQILRSTVMSLACRSFDGSVSRTCHWADGVPFNIRLYQTLLEACFDTNDKMAIMEEVDKALELIKKTWVTLGINQMLHNLCFSWVLFHRYVTTGQIENSLLFAAHNILGEVEKDAKATKDPVCSSAIGSILGGVLDWAEEKLLNYHDTFYSANIDLMQIVVSLAVLAAEVLAGNSSYEHQMKREEVDVAQNTVDRYIRSSARSAFDQMWNSEGNKELVAPSALEVLQVIGETLNAFFLLPVSTHPDLLPNLISGLDHGLQQYILKAISGCGDRNAFIPKLPALTRCSSRSRKSGVLWKKDKSLSLPFHRKKSQVGTNGDNSLDIQQLFLRINTLQRVRAEIEVLRQKIIDLLSNSKYTLRDDIEMGETFEHSVAASVEAIQNLSETTAYKVVFHDLTHVLWEGLYVGDISSSRIEPFITELDQHLEAIASMVHERVQTRVITDVMKASFNGFLLVLLAGGPSRTFTMQDSAILQEDFRLLKDLFWSNGDGLPGDHIDRLASTAEAILTLFQADTESLIEQFKQLSLSNNGGSSKSKFPMPPTPCRWSPDDPNTILRVLCHRNDEVAIKFLKKTFHLPKKL